MTDVNRWIVVLQDTGMDACACTLDAMCIIAVRADVRKFTIAGAPTADAAIDQAKWLLAMCVAARINPRSKYVGMEDYEHIMSQDARLQRVLEDIVGGGYTELTEEEAEWVEAAVDACLVRRTE